MKPEYWAGSEESWEAYQASLKKVNEYLAKTDRQEMKIPSLYNRVGNVGTIAIAGSLVSGMVPPIYTAFGIVGYENIKAAVLEGVKDKAADKLMLVSKSGGGAVDGCADCAMFIRGAAAAKPMNAFADFSASAAYWLSSAAPHITLSDTGIAGSIGILRIHAEISKMEQKEGITRTVMRAGKNKARMNPYEPLTAEVKKQEQAKLDYLHDRFIGTVAHHRGVSKAEVARNYGDGSTYIGTMAQDVGLVDATGDINQALAYAKSNTLKLDKSKITLVVTPTPVNSPDNSARLINEETSMDEDIIPTAEELAALASAEAGEDADNALDNTTAPTDITTATLADLQAQVPALESAITAKDSEIATLTAQVTEQTTAASAAAEALAAAQTSLAEANESLAALTPLVQASVKTLAVRLNKTVEASTLEGKVLAQTYGEYATAYAKAFKPGTKAAPSLEVGNKGEQVNKPDLNAVQTQAIDPEFALRLNSLK